jgi:outer membrane lipoprotein-sorting protein
MTMNACSASAPPMFAAAVLAVGLSIASGAGAQTDAGPMWGVEQLMQTLRQVKSARGRFTERKYMAILSTPLELSGTLVYAAPGHLEKHTVRPNPESLVLDRDVLTIESKDGNPSRTLALRDYPVLWAFVESIRSTLAGDLQTLNRFYRVGLRGEQSQWRLVLTPSEPKMQGVVREIQLGGSGDWINVIEVLETSGDRSVMTISRDDS